MPKSATFVSLFSRRILITVTERSNLAFDKKTIQGSYWVASYVEKKIYTRSSGLERLSSNRELGHYLRNLT